MLSTYYIGQTVKSGGILGVYKVIRFDENAFLMYLGALIYFVFIVLRLIISILKGGYNFTPLCSPIADAA